MRTGFEAAPEDQCLILVIDIVAKELADSPNERVQDSNHGIIHCM